MRNAHLSTLESTAIELRSEQHTHRPGGGRFPGSQLNKRLPHHKVHFVGRVY